MSKPKLIKISRADQMAAGKKKIKRPVSKRSIVWECNLHRMRTIRGLSLRDVEKGTGISNATLSGIERGMDLRLSTAMRICDFFCTGIHAVWPGKK